MWSTTVVLKTDTGNRILYECPHRMLPIARHLSRMVYNDIKTPYHAIYRSKNTHRLLTFLQVMWSVGTKVTLDTGQVLNKPHLFYDLVPVMTLMNI